MSSEKKPDTLVSAWFWDDGSISVDVESKVYDKVTDESLMRVCLLIGTYGKHIRHGFRCWHAIVPRPANRKDRMT
jgi:hypothetical protein